jgi:hypothetical protein
LNSYQRILEEFHCHLPFEHEILNNFDKYQLFLMAKAYGHGILMKIPPPEFLKNSTFWNSKLEKKPDGLA